MQNLIYSRVLIAVLSFTFLFWMRKSLEAEQLGVYFAVILVVGAASFASVNTLGIIMNRNIVKLISEVSYRNIVIKIFSIRVFIGLLALPVTILIVAPEFNTLGFFLACFLFWVAGLHNFQASFLNILGKHRIFARTQVAWATSFIAFGMGLFYFGKYSVQLYFAGYLAISFFFLYRNYIAINKENTGISTSWFSSIWDLNQFTYVTLSSFGLWTVSNFPRVFSLNSLSLEHFAIFAVMAHLVSAFFSNVEIVWSQYFLGRFIAKHDKGSDKHGVSMTYIQKMCIAACISTLICLLLFLPLYHLYGLNIEDAFVIYLCLVFGEFLRVILGALQNSMFVNGNVSRFVACIYAWIMIFSVVLYALDLVVFNYTYVLLFWLSAVTLMCLTLLKIEFSNAN